MSEPDRPRRAPALEPLLEESLDDLYEHAPCGYVSTLTDGTIVRVNETLLEWTGRGREDVLDTLRFQDLLAPGDRIFYETHYAPLLQLQGAVREIAVELVRADGSRLPVLVNAVLRRAPDGETGIIRTTVFDATERRGYEQELLRARRDAEARARASTALEHVDDGVLLVGADGRIAVANPAAREILAIDGDPRGRRVAEAVERWAEIEPHVPVGTPRAPAAPATLPVARGRHEQWLAVVGVDSGEGVVYTIRDVTADRRLETMRDELVRVVSHELRTPLTGVYGAAETLRSRDLPPEAQAQLVELLVEQAERLRRIVEQVLLTQQLDLGELELARAEVDVAEIARETADERVRVEAPAELTASGDPAYVREALRHLVDNALKYSDGAVVVRAEKRERHARLTVADEGPGIPPADRERVFERFQRLDPEQSSGVGGLGLGLYVARELVQRMEGRIWLDPRDGGAAFVVELPLSRR